MSVKTKKTVTVQMIPLDGVKVGRSKVYLEESEGELRAGPTGHSMHPADFARKHFPNKTGRRAFRKLLHKNGHADIAAQTVYSLGTRKYINQNNL